MLTLIWTACSSPGPGATPDDGPPTGQVTFHQDVAPLLAESCARCHAPAGFGPGDYLDYATAAAWAEVMVDRIDAGEMPPPAADPTCHPYRNAATYQVHPDLRDTLAAWIADGTPEGAPPPTPLAPVTPASLTRSDLELRAKGPWVPQVDSGNEYRCFLLGEVDTPLYITGLEFLIDHPEITHHSLLLIDREGQSRGLITDPATDSWSCTLGEMGEEIIHAWAPSGGAEEFPAGTGLRVAPGDQVILQVHYFDNAGAIPEIPADQPGYAFTIEPEVERELYYVAIGPNDFVIPAGDPAWSTTFEIPLQWLVGFGDTDQIWGVFPHMHMLGRAYDFHLTTRDGEEKCLSRADRYDYAMQPTYWFDEPVPMRWDDSISLSCTWDNSAANPLQLNDPPVDVGWGENTQQEMCYGFFYVSH